MIRVSDLSSQTLSAQKSVIEQLPQGQIVGVSSTYDPIFIEKKDLGAMSLDDYLKPASSIVNLGATKTPCKLNIKNKVAEIEVWLYGIKDIIQSQFGKNIFSFVIDPRQEKFVYNHATKSYVLVSDANLYNFSKLLAANNISSTVSGTTVVVNAEISSSQQNVSCVRQETIKDFYKKLSMWEPLTKKDYNLVQIFTREEAYFVAYQGNYGKPITELI